ncbi:cytochrome-c peroxidase [Cecembia calidifontis]|uniref:Cytochrome c peroxidase n=1 Tax=Cecembia calidifontis TaxID=1187080 RepID=A0A4Q7P9J7_9BACT|nr:cytochrome c peroxidase [Cecembia calidifontis]RZS96805.1 cytochrome c peroxidase [Cecembia calidifontis]
MPRKKKKYRILVWGILGFLFPLFLFSFDSHSPHQPEPYLLVYPAYFGGRIAVPDDNPTTIEGVELGRMLFYETKLSKNNQISCSSCHQQKLAFTDGKSFSDGVDGGVTKRNSMSLANLLWVRNLFWDGRSKSLEEQAVFPLTDPHEMGQSLEESVKKLEESMEYKDYFYRAFGSPEINEKRIVQALAQFQRTLISADAPYDRYLNGTHELTAMELLGLNLFMNNPDPRNGVRGANCGHCHGTPKLYKELFHNNGLDIIPNDPGRMEVTGQGSDLGRFRVPTLRNIAVTAPYMHDGRFQTLEEVLDHYNEHIQPSETLSPFLRNVSNEMGGTSLQLSKMEKNAIIAFLHTLTDSTFLTNPKFSDPHIKN